MTPKFAGTVFATTMLAAVVTSTAYPTTLVQAVAGAAVVLSLVNVLWSDSHKSAKH